MAENVECVKELGHDNRRITTYAVASLNWNTSYLIAYEDGPDSVFRNVGILTTDIGEQPRRKHMTFSTRQ
jgi:hypothetical protein